MKAVLDTNVLLIILPKISRYRPIFDALLAGEFNMPISTSILQEYMEIIEDRTSSRIANNLGELLSKLKNVENTKIYFKWNLIDVDPDDNKFVDCAIASQAHCIVTNDKHFNVLKSIEFPKVTIVTPDRFLELLEDEKH